MPASLSLRPIVFRPETVVHVLVMRTHAVDYAKARCVKHHLIDPAVVGIMTALFTV